MEEIQTFSGVLWNFEPAKPPRVNTGKHTLITPCDRCDWGRDCKHNVFNGRYLACERAVVKDFGPPPEPEEKMCECGCELPTDTGAIVRDRSGRVRKGKRKRVRPGHYIKPTEERGLGDENLYRRL
jgi:hypothetical protein